ncbi:MAG: YiiX/YebB-like N1pC/P60 family cysteine hydrolase [Thermoplasmatota archaeon]
MYSRRGIRCMAATTCALFLMTVSSTVTAAALSGSPTAGQITSLSSFHPQRGDLVFCELEFYNLDPGWDHVAIYIGDGLVIEATPAGEGVVRVNDLETLASYTKAVGYGRVKTANQSQRLAAVDFARSQLGKPYQYLDIRQPGANRLKDPDADAASWYCTELVWAAYHHQGIDLDLRGTLRGPVMPSEICWDDDVEMHTPHPLNRWQPGMYLRWLAYQLLHLPTLWAWLSLPVGVNSK